MAQKVEFTVWLLRKFVCFGFLEDQTDRMKGRVWQVLSVGCMIEIPAEHPNRPACGSTLHISRVNSVWGMGAFQTFP